jgi:ParB-like chromosome segregation protein Spo0J|nr:ParB N-terminal domain-containing protein [Actinocrinis sp.]
MRLESPQLYAGADGRDDSAAGLRFFSSGVLDLRAAVTVPLSSLRGTDSPRLTGENDDHALALAESGALLPPVIVHRTTMRVIDGAHRVNAAKRRGETEIAAVFFDGTENDAFVLGVELNISHGLPLSLADRKAAAARIIFTHQHWSDRAVAAVTGLAHQTVGAVRRSTGDAAHLNDRVGRDGRSRPLDAAEGRKLAAEFLARNPGASLREIAKAAGISPGTASNVRARVLRGEDPLPRRRKSSTARTGSGRVRVVMPLREQGSTIRHLRSDPSFRSKEAARMLLRLVEGHATVEPEWRRIVEAVPPHLRPKVVELATSCLGAWQSLVDELNAADGKPAR